VSQSGILSIDTSFLKKYLKESFRKGAFIRNLSVVMTGTAIAQIIMFAMMPIVSRLFSPSDFGIYGSFAAVLGFLSAGITLQYNQAIILPNGKEKGINLFWVTCLSVILVTIICAAVILLFPGLVQLLINDPSGWLLTLLAVAALINGLNQTFQAWCVRVKAFKPISLSQVIRSMSAIWIWIAAGFGHLGAVGLVVGTIFADIFASINLWRIVKRDLKLSHFSAAWPKVKQVAREFKDFPLFAAPQNMMNALSNGLPVLLLGYFYGIGVAGAYAFSIRVLQAPMTFLLTPLRQVLFQKASEAHNHGGNLYPLFIKTTGVLMVIAIIPCSILFICTPQIFSLVFGNAWNEAGVYARWLLLWLFIGFSNVPSVLFARILRQQRNLFLFELSVLFLRSAILVIGGLYFKPLTTIIYFSVLGFMLNAILILWIGLLLYCKNTKTETRLGTEILY